MSAAEQHISDMLTLATAKHRETIAAVEARPVNLEQLHGARMALADAKLLCEDCYLLTGDLRLATALEQLREQQRLLEAGIARIESMPSQSRSTWPGSLFLTFAAVLTAFLI